MTVKQHINDMYNLFYDATTKKTLKQEQERQKQELLNDINNAIETEVFYLLEEKQNNLYNFYTSYLNKKYEIVEDVFDYISSLKVEKLVEVATLNGWEYQKKLVNKHFINTKNERETRALIQELLNTQVKKIIKDKEEEEKLKSKLAKMNASPEQPNKKRSGFTICGVSPLTFLLALIVGVTEGLAYEPKKRRH